MAKGYKTGGRKKGTKNKRTFETELRGSGELPLDYMLRIMRDETKPLELRAEMAKAAAPYCHARRAPEDKAGRSVPPVCYIHPSLEADGSDLQEPERSKAPRP